METAVRVGGSQLAVCATKTRARDLLGANGVREEMKFGLHKAREEMEIRAGCKFDQMSLTDADLTAIFKKYDVDGSGEIDYDEFANALMGNGVHQFAALPVLDKLPT